MRNRQRGVALVVAMILLVIATLIGLAASRGTLLQERMSSNAYDRSLAFQRSEAALRAAEVAITAEGDIADLGGVTIAYAAYQKSLAGRPAPVIDGFSGPQRFFIGYAQVWRGSIRDAELRLMIRTNPHSPQEFRTLVPLSNVDAFYKAFEVKSDDAWYRTPADRVEVW